MRRSALAVRQYLPEMSDQKINSTDLGGLTFIKKTIPEFNDAEKAMDIHVTKSLHDGPWNDCASYHDLCGHGHLFGPCDPDDHGYANDGS